MMAGKPNLDMDLPYLAGQIEKTDEMLRKRYEWATRQSADLRAKAELLEKVDDPIKVYGTNEPEKLYQMAKRLDRIAARLRAGEQFALERYHD